MLRRGVDATDERVQDEVMSNYEAELSALQSMIDELRRVRERTCEPKHQTNPRYHALSSAISSINRAMEDMTREA
jgi:hypothetical protein